MFSPYAVSAGETRCGLCRRLEPPFVKAAAYGSYDGGLRELIHLLKYEQVRPAAEVLGRMLAEAISGLEPDWTERAVFGCPRAIAHEEAAPARLQPIRVDRSACAEAGSGSGRMILHPRVLERRRETQSQIGLTRHQRRENLRGSLRWPGRRKSPAAKSCWWTMYSPPAPPPRNARAFCGGRAHLKYLSLR